ncbi:MAG: cation transporter [Veillonellaceae bacterium]|nr:cation transporter [Veillonellaceae bacterium]
MSHHKVPDNKKGLRIAIGITALILLLEFFGGLATNSLALLSDAGHMLSDVSSLVFSLLAMWLAAKPPTADKHYGYSRVEILAALLNGVTLFVIAGLILYEAYHRFLSPEPVSSLQMMVIAVIGLLANLLSAWALLHQGDVKSNINMRSAYLHVLGDALGSVGAIAAGLLMYFWNWYLADPLISVFVAVLILKGAWGVIRQAVHILMEGTPATINARQVQAQLEQIDGVLNVHDLRIWTITSGIHSLSCHLLVDERADSQAVLQLASSHIHGDLGVRYATVQIETQTPAWAKAGHICTIC